MFSIHCDPQESRGSECSQYIVTRKRVAGQNGAWPFWPAMELRVRMVLRNLRIAGHNPNQIDPINDTFDQIYINKPDWNNF